MQYFSGLEVIQGNCINLICFKSKMADIIKIKPKKKYQWNQDKKFVYIEVPLPSHTSLKKVQIFLSDLILRVTSLEKKQTHFLDLSQQVDYRSPQNKFIFNNRSLHATLKKLNPEHEWTNLLIEDISLADLKTRRKDSQARYEENIKNIEENKGQLRIQFDRKATQQLMRFEKVQREILEEKKLKQKEQAIRQVFSNVNEKTGHFEKQKKAEKTLEIQRTQEKWIEKEKLALTLLEQEEAIEKAKIEKERQSKTQHKIIEEVTKQYEKSKAPLLNNTMFTEQDVQKNEELRQNIEDGVQFEQIPIRKAAVQKVNFTERIHKGLAARDHFIKEPPMPKNKGGKHNSGDVESTNPLWLKDKGDSFFKDKNYLSAVEAYSEALKSDSKLIAAILNRSACFMKMFKIQEAISDCDQAILLLQSQISGDEQQQENSRLTFAKIKTRKAICTAWKGQLQSSKTILKQVQQLDLNEAIKSEVNHCLEQIKKREESIQSKIKGDELVRLNQYESAIGYYSKSQAIDQNQYSLSNKVLCLNKARKFKQATEEAQKGIKKLAQFNLGSSNIQTKEDKQASIILLKLFYRKAKALEQLDLISEAEENIRKGLTINSEDRDLQQYLKSLKKKQNKALIKFLKQEAAQFIKQSKINQALQNYSKCLKMLEEAEDIQEYLAVLQNQCVCYQKLQKYDDVLSTCIRILKLVNRIQSKILEFGSKKQSTTIEKEELKKISVRTLVRRANAYIKTSQYYNAKSDLEKALEINPGEQSVRKELTNLKAKLNE